MRRFYGISVFVIVLLIQTACIQVNIPDVQGKKTNHYTLNLPKNFQPPPVPVAISEFASETPAKFRMLFRKGSELEQETLSKWVQTPSVLLSCAFRDLFGCDNADSESAKWILEGDIYTFEKNLDTNTADLKVLYRLINRKNGDVRFVKLLNTSVPVSGASPADFANAMSKAVVEQAETIKMEITDMGNKQNTTQEKK